MFMPHTLHVAPFGVINHSYDCLSLNCTHTQTYCTLDLYFFVVMCGEFNLCKLSCCILLLSCQ